MRNKLSHPTCAAALAGALALLSALPARAQFLGPTPYLSFGDSPFNGVSFSYFHLEDFEDGALNVPGASATSGWTVLGPAPLTDSVDGDDGAIDGSGTGGHSFYSNFAASTLTITFSAAALGALPTHAGLVWTDVGNVTSGTTGFGPVTFAAADQNGASLGSIGPFALGDGVFNGSTAEDRFFGVVNPGGISSITISMSNSVDWEVDHLQFGRVAASAVPEPGFAALLCASAPVGLLLLRRRK